MRTRKKTVALTELQEPNYLSLVGLPANRAGFKVVREDGSVARVTSEGSETSDVSSTDMPSKEGSRKRKKKCSDPALLSIQLPPGATADDAASILVKFDLEEDYEVAHDDSGNVYLRRKDCLEVDPTTYVEVPLSGGMVANISQAVFHRYDIKGVTGVSLARIDFDSTFGKIEEVKAWLEKNEIVCNNLEEVEGGFIANRVDTKAILKPVSIEEGIRGYVMRSENTDIPVKVYRSVIEQSYGNYGWGHVDFASALADPEYTEDCYDAIYILRDVLENILLYSALPLEERKVLVQNACSNFASYISAMMDALPRAAMPPVSQQTSDKAKSEKDMPNSNEAKAPEAQQYVTRSELESIVESAVSKALASSTAETKKEETATRSDETTQEPASAAASVDTTVIEAVKAIADTQKAMLEAITGIRSDVAENKKEIEALGSSTTTRRSDEDAKETTVDEGSKSKKRGDVFSGVLGFTL